jgi:hypothetical protein
MIFSEAKIFYPKYFLGTGSPMAFIFVLRFCKLEMGMRRAWVWQVHVAYCKDNHNTFHLGSLSPIRRRA